MQKQKAIEIPKLHTPIAEIKIENVKGSTLLMQKMSQETKKELDEKYGRTGKAKLKGKQEKKQLTDEQVVEGKTWRTLDGKVGFPASGFQKALLSMAKLKELEGVSGKLISGSVKILGNIVPIEHKKLVVNEDWGKASGMTGAPMKILRPELIDWSCKLQVMYDESMISLDQIVNLLNKAGFYIGIGSWRPGEPNGGNHGMFQVTLKK